MARIQEVDDSHISLARMIPVQTPGVLLQCTPPGHLASQG